MWSYDIICRKKIQSGWNFAQPFLIVSLNHRKNSPKFPIPEHPFFSHFRDDVITDNFRHRHFHIFSNIFVKNGSNLFQFSQKTYFRKVFQVKTKESLQKFFQGVWFDKKWLEIAYFDRFSQFLSNFLLHTRLTPWNNFFFSFKSQKEW